MTEQELYDMKLHETKKNVKEGWHVRRVIGGWIYILMVLNSGVVCNDHCVFVPEQSMESGMINPDDKAPEAYRFVE